MTTDASRDVRDREADREAADEDAADAGRPSLADWLVVSVRPSQMPPAAAPNPAETSPESPSASSTEPGAEPEESLAPAPLGSDDTASLTSTPQGGLAAFPDEGAALPDVSDVDPAADADAPTHAQVEGSEFGSSSSFAPQIFSAGDPDSDSDPDVDAALAAVLLSPAARARRAAFFRGAFFVLGALLVLFFLGRRFLGGHSAPKTVASPAAPLPSPAPLPVMSAAPTEPEEIAEEESSQAAEGPPTALESTSRTNHPGPPDSTSAAPLVAPAWSVARFPDLPRDVLIACEQAALQAHSAASPGPAPTPPSQ